MARRRYQNPKPFIEGAWWYVRLWADAFVDGKAVRKLKRIKLAASDKPKRTVQRMVEEIVRPINQGLVTVGPAISFADYVKNSYSITALLNRPKSVQQAYKAMLRKYLLPALGSMSMSEITPFTVQALFSSMPGRGVPYTSICKSRDALSHVMRNAQEHAHIHRNPMEGLELPPDTRAKKPKPFLYPAQLENLLQLIPEPYATMVHTAAWTGLRVSELLALKWYNVGPDWLRVDQGFCRGSYGKTKTGASAATISVMPHVIERIQKLKTLTIDVRAGRAVRHYKLVKRDSPDAVVFQSVKAGKPMNDQNILRRYIRPAAEKLGLEGIDWRCLRRTCATWMVQAGADPKSVQGQMRHSRITTTMEIYAQFVPEGQRRAVEQMSEFARRSVQKSGTNPVTIAVQ